MKTLKYVWKIVCVELSTRGIYNYFSSETIGKYKLQYRINKKTTANIGLIFVFQTKIDAQTHIINLNESIRSNFSILKSIPHGNPQPILSRCYWDEFRFPEFWNNTNLEKLKISRNLPKGTVGVPAITPVAFSPI